MDCPTKGMPNPIGPPPGYEQYHMEPRVTDVQVRLENQIKELKAMITRVLGVLAPPKRNHPQSFANSLFVKSICLTMMWSKFVFPTIRPYDGTSNPDDHIAQYKQIVHHYKREACMCKGFGFSLVGPALQWFIGLPNISLSTFVELYDMFV